MKKMCVTCAMLITCLTAVFSAVADDSEPRVAPIWQRGRHYEAGDLVTYNGSVFKALAGASHKHPDDDIEEGWRRLNGCGDESKNAVRCELSKRGAVISTDASTKDNYQNVQGHMTSGYAPGSTGRNPTH